MRMMKFNSKIILFGEYAVLSGSQLLAIPYSKFSGHLSIPDKKNSMSSTGIASNNTLKKLYKYLVDSKVEFNFKQKLFWDELNQGLYFESNIPLNYGVGSSGALVASVYHRFFESQNNTTNLKTIQTNLAQIESFFHGSSSGADPLVSYINKPILINRKISDVSLKNSDINAFLIDSSKISSTKHLVEGYKLKELSRAYKTSIDAFIDLTNKVIEAYISNTPALFSLIQKLAQTEKQLLPEMFVNNVGLQHIEKKVNEQLAIKLCGSGGGGFLLGFCKKQHYKNIINEFKSWNISTLAL